MGTEKKELHLVSPTSRDPSTETETRPSSIALHGMFSDQDDSPSSPESSHSSELEVGEGRVPIKIESTTDFLLLGILQALQEGNAIKKTELELKLAMLQKEQALAKAAQEEAEKDEDRFEQEIRWKIYT